MTEHWCKEHQTVWFKKGKMKGYAHPILEVDGEPTGEWCNEPKGEVKPPELQPEMSKDDWIKKDRITRKSIERQKALELAVEMAKLFGADKATTAKIIATAKLFEAYLEGEPGTLVEEAKKLGATEIKEGE